MRLTPSGLSVFNKIDNVKYSCNFPKFSGEYEPELHQEKTAQLGSHFIDYVVDIMTSDKNHPKRLGKELEHIRQQFEFTLERLRRDGVPEDRLSKFREQVGLVDQKQYGFSEDVNPYLNMMSVIESTRTNRSKHILIVPCAVEDMDMYAEFLLALASKGNTSGNTYIHKKVLDANRLQDIYTSYTQIYTSIAGNLSRNYTGIFGVVKLPKLVRGAGASGGDGPDGRGVSGIPQSEYIEEIERITNEINSNKNRPVNDLCIAMLVPSDFTGKPFKSTEICNNLKDINDPSITRVYIDYAIDHFLKGSGYNISVLLSGDQLQYLIANFAMLPYETTYSIVYNSLVETAEKMGYERVVTNIGNVPVDSLPKPKNYDVVTGEVPFIQAAFKNTQARISKSVQTSTHNLLELSPEFNWDRDVIPTDAIEDNYAYVKRFMGNQPSVLQAITNDEDAISEAMKLPPLMIIAGQPGSGKTLFAQAVASRLSKDFRRPFTTYFIQHTNFKDRYAGESERRFESVLTAMKTAKNTIFIMDEGLKTMIASANVATRGDSSHAIDSNMLTRFCQFFGDMSMARMAANGNILIITANYSEYNQLQSFGQEIGGGTDAGDAGLAAIRDRAKIGVDMDIDLQPDLYIKRIVTSMEKRGFKNIRDYDRVVAAVGDEKIAGLGRQLIDTVLCLLLNQYISMIERVRAELPLVNRDRSPNETNIRRNEALEANIDAFRNLIANINRDGSSNIDNFDGMLHGLTNSVKEYVTDAGVMSMRNFDRMVVLNLENLLNGFSNIEGFDMIEALKASVFQVKSVIVSDMRGESPANVDVISASKDKLLELAKEAKLRDYTVSLDDIFVRHQEFRDWLFSQDNAHGNSITTILEGKNDGNVSGYLIYGSKSDLNTAAVHAGKLSVGETNRVRLFRVDINSADVPILGRGVVSNGINSSDIDILGITNRVIAFSFDEPANVEAELRGAFNARQDQETLDEGVTPTLEDVEPDDTESHDLEFQGLRPEDMDLYFPDTTTKTSPSLRNVRFIQERNDQLGLDKESQKRNCDELAKLASDFNTDLLSNDDLLGSYSDI